MSKLSLKLLTDTWIVADWEEYQQAIADVKATNINKFKSYYYQGHLRLEMSPVSFDHAKDHTSLIYAVTLFPAIKAIPSVILDTCSFQKIGFRECQPDIACYFREKADIIPSGTGIVNLNLYPVPDLAIEISKTSLLDDLGTKRSLYEDLGVAEYWVVNVQNAEIVAYTMTNGGSWRIRESLVLPGLAITVLEEALHQSRTINQSQVSAWLMSQFQS